MVGRDRSFWGAESGLVWACPLRAKPGLVGPGLDWYEAGLDEGRGLVWGGAFW